MGCIIGCGYVDCDRIADFDPFRVVAVRTVPAATQPKTPRLAGCGATSPLFFCPSDSFHPLSAAAAIAVARKPPKVHIQPMDGTQQTAIHQALVTVQQAVTTMTFPSCDQGDLIELIDRVEEELHSAHPNLGLLGTFLNSIARSLRAQPEAREVCLVIEDAIGTAGITSTWQSGI